MIAITAANGRLGQAVIKALTGHLSPADVRLAARSPEKLLAYQDRGFQVAKADYDDPAGMEQAFAGIETLLLISGAGPNDVRIANHRAAVTAAQKAGVRRIVYTSFVNPTPESKFSWAAPHVDTEAFIRSSGLAFIFLRDNQYAANLDSLLAKAVATGVFAMPGASGKVAYVTHQDVAAAIVGALTGRGTDNTVYTLTGPEAFDGQDIAAALSTALDRTITAVDAPYADFEAAFQAAGFPPFVVEGLLSLYASAEAGEDAMVTADVASLSGRPATSLRDYIAAFVTK